MNRWLTVILLVLVVLVGAMGLRNLVVHAQPAVANGMSSPVLMAGTSAPVPPDPWSGTSAPVPPDPWSGTSAPVPPDPWNGTSAPVPPDPWGVR
jgi:hypothetical protein